MEVLRPGAQAPEHVVKLGGAHGDVLGVDDLGAVEHGHADAARADVGDHGVAGQGRTGGQLFDDLGVDIGLLLAVLQHLDLQAVAHPELVGHQGAVSGLPQGGAGDDLGFFDTVGEQGRGEFPQDGGELPEALEADEPIGEHVVAQAHGVFQLVQGDHLVLAELGHVHAHIVGTDLDDGRSAGGAFFVQGRPLQNLQIL